MKRSIRSVLALVAATTVVAALPAAAADAKIGAPAPGFTLTDTNGTPHALSDFVGKVVVLEWTNPDCPFVRKHYDSKNMQSLQKKYTAEGVVWLTINSSAPGKQGSYAPEKWNAMAAKQSFGSTAILLDPDGTVGRAYGAKTTPDMYVIDASGVLRYAGAIDSIASTDRADLAKATNYVAAALDAILSGAEVATEVTQPYGCSVKY